MTDLARGATWSGEFEVQRRDGTVFPAHVTDTPLFDAAGSLTGVIGVSMDITARKRSEEALRRSEERHRKLIETAQEGIWQIDAEGRTSFVSEHMAEMLGYRPEEILGRPAVEFTPESELPAAQERQRRRQSGEGGQSINCYRCKDGSLRWFRAQAHSLTDEHGANAGGLGLLADITAEREALQTQAWLASIAQAFPDALIGIAPGGIIESWSPGAARLYGYSAAEAIGRHAGTLLTPAAHVDETRRILRRLGVGEAVTQFETVRRHKDGHLVACC